ncbi:MAG: hypothetical protein JSW05_04390 [Candidatus Thorarchaeota archaeon]|nr:MAG: hypothetical protein JSW05_04390 [Candidatus Thorarchaeota archaeon]
MSEAGKELVLREALATHLRSTRDRQLFSQISPIERPAQELLAAFASFYLQSYLGVRLHTLEEAEGLSIEEQEQKGEEDREQLEREIIHLLGRRFQDEVFTEKVVSEFIIRFCDELGTLDPTRPETISSTQELIREHLAMIPQDSSTNHDVDFLNRIMGLDSVQRQELYSKASGLKETALSLRDEVLREHDSEVIEISVLKEGLKRIWGAPQYASAHLSESMVFPVTMTQIAADVAKQFCKGSKELAVVKKSHEIRLNMLGALKSILDRPTTLDELERVIVSAASQNVASAIQAMPESAFEIISQLVQIPVEEIESAFRRKRLTDPEDIVKGLLTTKEPAEEAAPESEIDEVEMEYLERSIKAIDRLENTLEKPVKGMLRYKGLRASELDKFTVQTLTKDRDTLLGFELQVLEALEQRMRVPSPEDVKRLLEAREKVNQGALSSIGVTSSSAMIEHRLHEETIASVKLDLAWHVMSSVMTNLARVVETYVRSRQDLLRIKALLKSIYEGTETDLQALREEILIDLASARIYELKTVYPDLGASDICSWMHARLSDQDMTAAKKELDATPSPVFEGVIDTPLVMDALEFDNYAIAYDIMHRFLKTERRKKMAKEELAVQAKIEEQRIAESKRSSLDVLSWIHTKSQTVFRSIGRVGPKGLEWTMNDDTKCANLLAYYVKTNRGRKVCSICAEAPSDGKCPTHGRGEMVPGNDMENLAVFVSSAITDIKRGLIGSTAEPMSFKEARSIVDREISKLKRIGKLTPKTMLKKLMPGEINYIVGPAISKVVGQYFNESLKYAARRADIA